MREEAGEGEAEEEEERSERHCKTSLSHPYITHNHRRGTTQKWEHTRRSGNTPGCEIQLLLLLGRVLRLR
jgi:hypothetical protein